MIQIQHPLLITNTSDHWWQHPNHKNPHPLATPTLTILSKNERTAVTPSQPTHQDRENQSPFWKTRSSYLPRTPSIYREGYNAYTTDTHHAGDKVLRQTTNATTTVRQTKHDRLTKKVHDLQPQCNCCLEGCSQSQAHPSDPSQPSSRATTCLFGLYWHQQYTDPWRRHDSVHNRLSVLEILLSLDAQVHQASNQCRKEMVTNHHKAKTPAKDWSKLSNPILEIRYRTRISSKFHYYTYVFQIRHRSSITNTRDPKLLSKSRTRNHAYMNGIQKRSRTVYIVDMGENTQTMVWRSLLSYTDMRLWSIS